MSSFARSPGTSIRELKSRLQLVLDENSRNDLERRSRSSAMSQSTEQFPIYSGSLHDDSCITVSRDLAHKRNDKQTS